MGWKNGRFVDVHEHGLQGIHEHLPERSVNVFQSGDEAFAYISGLEGGTQMVAYQDPFEKAAVDSLLEAQYKKPVYQYFR